jgi:hypothetical protein
MKIEKEIAGIVTPLEREDVQIFWKDTDSATLRLHLGLRRNEIKSDSDAYHFMQSTGDGIGEARFRVFKHRFRKRALNSLYFLKLRHPETPRSTIKLYRLWKDVFRIRVLLEFGARNTAIWLIKRNLNRATATQSTWTEVELLDHLRRHYALTGQNYEYEATCAKLHRKVEIYEAELRTSQMYERLALTFVRSAGNRAHLPELAEEYDILATQYYQRFGTNNIAISRFRISILNSQLKQRYTRTLQLCDEAEEYFLSVPEITPRSRFGEIALNRLDSYLYLRDYERGAEIADILPHYFPVGKNNWFIYMESFFLLAMHTLHFADALRIHKEVTSHPRFVLQPEARQERWRVFELCLRFAAHAGDIINFRTEAMDVNSLLSSVPIYTKDKQGYNVQILIMHILLLLERGDLDAITQRMEALNSYRSRYLRPKTNPQSSLFFRLLSIMVKEDFDYERVVVKGKKHYMAMKSLPSAYSEVHEGVQILSYPWLWERVMDHLRERTPQTVNRIIMQRG